MCEKKTCKKTCYCLKVPFVPNPSYSVDILRLNPLNPLKQCSCCHKVKQHSIKNKLPC